MAALTNFEKYYSQPHTIEELTSYSFYKDRPSKVFTPLVSAASTHFKINRELEILRKCAEVNLKNLNHDQRKNLIDNAKRLFVDLSDTIERKNKIDLNRGFVEPSEVKEAKFLLEQICMDPRAQDLQEMREGIAWLLKRPQLLEHTEGLMRISASPESLEELKKTIKKQQPIADDASAHAVAGVVKRAASDSYASLMAFTKDELDEFASLGDEEQQILWIKNKIEEKLDSATSEERKLFVDYILLLNAIAHYQEKNKMSEKNLSLIISTVFTAKLGEKIIESKDIPPDQKQKVIEDLCKIAQKVVENMITYPSRVLPQDH